MSEKCATKPSSGVVKLLVYAGTIILVLIGTVWAITWGTSNGRLDKHDTKFETVEVVQSDHKSKIAVLEKQIETIDSNVKLILDEIRGE